MCEICYHDKTVPIQRHTEPDMYMKLIDFPVGDRTFNLCLGCGLITQDNLLTDEDLDRIYEDYRGDRLRANTVKESFMSLVGKGGSENMNRWIWLRDNIDYMEKSA